jgi:hypothetical protein
VSSDICDRMSAISLERRLAERVHARRDDLPAVYMTSNAWARAKERRVPLTRIRRMTDDVVAFMSSSHTSELTGQSVFRDGPLSIVWERGDDGDVYVQSVIVR